MPNDLPLTMKDLVKNRHVRFVYYRDGALFYEVVDSSPTFRFPVPVSDAGPATFKAEDKAILFLRWIRRECETREGGPA